MRTAEFDRQLAEEHEELKQAKAASTSAAEALAGDPTNPQHRTRVVNARQRIAELQAGIEAIEAARAAAVALDNSDETRALRARRAEAAKRTNALHTDIQAAAREVDKAFAALVGRLEALTAGRDAAKQAASEYLELTETDPGTRFHHSEMLFHTPSLQAHAITSGMYQAAQAAGVSLNDYVVFNLYAMSPKGDTVEAAIISNAERVASCVNVVEQMHG